MKVYAIYGFTPYEGSNDAIALFLHREAAENALNEGSVLKGYYYESYGVEEYEVSEVPS